MPKSTFCRDPVREARVSAAKEFLEGNIAKCGMSTEQLAKKTGINKNTLNMRRREPETIRLGELWALMDALHPDEYYLRRIIGGETR